MITQVFHNYTKFGNSVFPKEFIEVSETSSQLFDRKTSCVANKHITKSQVWERIFNLQFIDFIRFAQFPFHKWKNPNSH